MMHDDRIKLAIAVCPQLLDKNILLWVGQQLLTIVIIKLVVFQIKYLQNLAFAKEDILNFRPSNLISTDV